MRIGVDLGRHHRFDLGRRFEKREGLIFEGVPFRPFRVAVIDLELECAIAEFLHVLRAVAQVPLGPLNA